MSIIYNPSNIPLRIPYSHYRSFNQIKPIRIIGINEKLTDYQIKIELDSTNFPFEKCRADGYDVRFLDADGQSLDYWLESWSKSNRSATLWTKIPEIPALTNKLVWLIYSNPSASSASNIGNTFLFGDDFADGNYTSNLIWTVGAGTWSAANYYLTKTAGASWDYISTPSTSDTVVWEYRAAVGYVQQFFFMASTVNPGTADGYFVYFADNPDRILFYRSDGGSHILVDQLAQAFDGAFHDIRITRDSNSEFKIYYDDALKITHTDNTHTISSYVIQRVQNSQNTDKIDDIRIRKYNFPEPQVIVL